MKLNKTIFCSLICIFTLWGVYPAVHAQQFDQSYQVWKAQQQAHDQRLKAQASPDYYLGKPSLHTHAGNSKTASAKSVGSKININQASVQELQQLNGIGEKKAQAIVDYRNQNGQFKAVNELLNIKGIGPKFIEKNKANLSL